MNNLSRSALLSLLFGMLGTLAFTGCGQPSLGPGLATWDTVNSDYRSFTQEGFPYPLPKGVDFPESLPKESLDERGAAYQLGYGKALAYVYWSCAWQDHILSATDADEREAAFAQYARGMSDPVYRRQFPDPDKSYERAVIIPAKLGDLSRLQTVYQSDCGWYRGDSNG